MALNRIQTDGIEDGAVDTSKILDGILGTADITNDTLTNAKFSNSAAIPTSKLSGLATSATTDTTNATNITSGSLATARVNVGTTAGKILQVDGSGNLPAIDGSLLTGIVSFTKSASDPTVSTNPSAGVGAEWVNTTSGEVYLCTDATAGANVWTNVGAGTGDIAPVWPMQTSNYGYVCGGTSTGPQTKDIQRWAYASDTNATDVGDLQCDPVVYNSSAANLGKGLRYYGGANMSATHGYSNGGNTPYYNSSGANYAVGSTVRNEKFSFASLGTSTNIADMRKHNSYHAGCNTSTHGYVVGGGKESNNAPNYSFFAASAPTAGYEDIDKFAYASDAATVDTTANLSIERRQGVGLSTLTHGFCCGGYNQGSTSAVNVIDKFPFASSTNAVDHGDLIGGSGYMRNTGGSTSTTHGYTHGGYDTDFVNTIQSFAFSSNTTASDHGDLIEVAAYISANGSSTQGYGYSCGGYSTQAWTKLNRISKYAQASAANATDVADLITTSVSASTYGICQS